MAKKKNNYPPEMVAIYEKADDDPVLLHYDSIEDAIGYEASAGEIVEIAVYKFDRVIKVKKESSFKVID